MKSALFTTLSCLLARKNLTESDTGRLLEAFSNDKTKLFEASFDEIAAISENDSVAELICLCSSLASRRGTESFALGKTHTDEEIKSFLLNYYLNVGRETVVMLSLDSKNRIVGVDRIGEGTVTVSNVIPRMLIEKAMSRKSDSIILSHNHPGGNATPSLADETSTRTLSGVLKSCGINLLKHYVVGGGEVSEINPERS